MLVSTTREKGLLRFRRFVVPIILISLCFALGLVVKGPLRNKVIGMFEYSGLRGEILMQGNFIYNFEKGNVFKHFETKYLNYPFGENLGFGPANSLHLFMYIPLRYFFGVIEAYNLLVIIIFLLNFLSAYLLARYLFKVKPIAVCSALVFALNSYILLKMNLGFSQKCAVFWIPLYCLALFKLRDTKQWRYAFGAAFVLSLIQMTYPPYGYYSIIFTVLLLSYLFLRRRELQFAFSRFVFVIIFFIFLSSFLYYLMGFGLVYFGRSQLVLNTNIDGCLDLFRPFKFFPYQSSHFPSGLPLGISISAFILGAIAFIKNKGLPRLIFIVFLFFVVIAAGSFLIHNGRQVFVLGHSITLPFYFMSKYLPFAGQIFFSIRAFPFINICLAILTGYGLLSLSPINKKIKPLLIAIFFLFIYLLEQTVLFPQLFPPKVSNVSIPRFYKEIKNDDFEAILNLPITSNVRINNYYGYYGVLSEKKMMNSYRSESLSIYLPKNFDDQKKKKEFIQRLSLWGVRYIVVHKKFLKDKLDESLWLENFCESRIYPEDNLLVYQVPLADKSVN